MFRRIDSAIGRAAAATMVVATVFVGSVAVAGTEPPPDAPPPVETGEVDGATVAVGPPPVPPTTAEVAVGLPPVPPTTPDVAVAAPPVPRTTTPVRVAAATPAPVVELDPDVVAQLTSMVVDAATSAALALRR